MRFDLEGVRFFMASEERVSVHESEDARLVCELENPKRVLCVAPGEVCFLSCYLLSFL